MPSLSDLDREVHLWHWPTDGFSDADLTRAAEQVLSSEERQRVAKFAFEKDRRAYLTAHWFLRLVLSHYVSVEPNRWDFARSLLGKPTIAAPRLPAPLFFNLSHTEGRVACAVTSLGNVGVDVETVQPRSDLLALAQRFFAAEEVAQLKPLEPARQLQAFYRIWTLKEAFLKANGQGLTRDLASFAFQEIFADTIVITFSEGASESAEEWRFFQHEPDEQHKIAIAVHCPAKSSVECRVFSEIPPGLNWNDTLQ